jgi:hypothetical protein
MSGHLQLVPQPIATANDSHDAEHGDGNNSRKRAVHGWIVQGQVALTNPQFQAPVVPCIVQIGKAAWARPLAQSTTALTPFLGDFHATFDADPLE